MGLLQWSWGGAVDTGGFCFSACLTSGNGGSDRRIALSFKLTWLSPVKFSIWANFGGRNVVPYPNMVRCHSPYNFHWLIYSPRFFLFFSFCGQSKKDFFWYAYTYRYLLIFKNAFIIATARATRTLIAVRQKLFFFMIFDSSNWTFSSDCFTERVRKWYPASLKDKKTLK